MRPTTKPRDKQFWEDVFSNTLSQNQVAKKYNCRQSYISELRNDGITPKREDGQIVCGKCGQGEFFVVRRKTLVCDNCALTMRTINWKEGFTELYTFFKEVMQNVEAVIPTEDAQNLWNELLQKRNMAVISELGKEVT